MNDPYSRLHYRRLIAWPQRIEREWPLMRELFAAAPSPRLLDLGCGTGEHSRFLAEKGFEVVGIDRSESLLAQARREPLPAGVRFLAADLAALAEVAPEISPESPDEPSCGGAFCIGNSLPHLLRRDDLRSLFAALRRLLLPGAPLLLQILNYERIYAQGERYLPLNFRPEPGVGGPEGEEGQIVFLRLMHLGEDGCVVFAPSTLRFRPWEEEPVAVVSSKRVRLRAWKPAELEELLETAGFRQRTLYGGFDRRPFGPGSDRDLVLVAK